MNVVFYGESAVLFVWQIQELVRGAKNAVSLAQVCFSISQRSCCSVVLYLYGEMVSGVFSFSNV